MPLSTGEKIRIILGRRGMSIAQLAMLTEQSRQNLSNKISRDNFQESDLTKIAQALNCTYESSFVMNDTGEKV